MAKKNIRAGKPEDGKPAPSGKVLAMREKFKKIPEAAKAAPKKIVEHTLEATFQTVEKAAESQARKAAKKALRATAKARKAVRAMAKAKKAAQKAEFEAAALSAAYPAGTGNNTASENKKPAGRLPRTTSSAAKQAARGIRQKLRQILTPVDEVFYYDRRQIVLLTVAYAMLSCLVWVLGQCMLCTGFSCCGIASAVMILVMALTLMALASVVFVLLFPQKLAVVNKTGIKIDHNALLKWDDIATAEEKYTGWMANRPIIALHLKPEADYKLTFMQKLCRHNVFTPFSIPLYAMRADDASKIKALIRKFAPDYKDSRF